MRIRRIVSLSVSAAWIYFMLGGLLSAHHSQAGYDTDDKTRILKGVVVEYKWRNPHVFIVWDVKDDKGTVVQWVGERPSVQASLAPRWRSHHARAEPIPTVGERRDARPTLVPLHSVVPALKSSS